MGLQDVTAEIIEEAETRAEQIREEAAARRDELISEAEEEADRIVDEAEEQAKQEAEALRQKKLSSARMEAKQERLAAREELLDQTFKQFHDRIEDMDDDKEEELIENALEMLDDQVEIGTVYVRDQFESTAADYGDVETHDDRGLVVETADGSRRFNLRFDTVADRVIDNHRQDVAEVLFE